jgi:hypothetical protein
MRFFVWAAAISVFLVSQMNAAHAGMPIPKEMTCPVGGKKFTFIATASFSKWGSRPDGKPYGSWIFPMPVPACPDNGLVLYRKFSDEEIKQLEQILKTSAFQPIKRQATHYRIAWFMRALHEKDEMTALWMINQASWQADGNPEIKARYQREFAEGVANLPNEPDNLDWIVLQGRAANAWRELGDFARAKQVVSGIPIEKLEAPIPAEVVEGTTASGLGKTASNYAEIEAAKNKRSWLSYFTGLKALIERQDRTSEPLDMIPIRVAAGKCMDMASTARLVDPYCENEVVKKQIEGFSKIQEAIAAERAKEQN